MAERDARPTRETIAGVILAGGRSLRMGGGDKALVTLGGIALLAHARDRLAPQVARMMISANGEPQAYAPFRLPVRADPVPGHAGPLAGILAAMIWAGETSPAASHVLSVAADTPFFPPDLADRLAQAAQAGAVAVAASGGRIHPVFALWPVALAPDLAGFLERPGRHSVMEYAQSRSCAQVEFEAPPGGIDPFFNINTPQDLEAARAFAG